MRTLTLIIKQKFFDEIIAGTKKLETRDIRPNTFKKYYEYNEKGELLGLMPYDAIQFYVGYNTDRQGALVTIKSSELVVLVDDDTNEDITYLHNSVEYVATQAEYTLDNVISKQNF